jgi:phage anti-repressor protein
MAEIISQAIVKYGNKASEQQLAEIVGFTEDEQKMLKIFWEPAFNKSWIYLSPSMITKEMGYSAVSKFYRDTLRKHYKENVDYKETDENDPTVKLFENSEWRSESIQKKQHSGGKKQKYYLVSGRALKKMLMRCRTKKSEEICEYYIKVEELASFMKDYILELSKRQIAEQEKLLNHANSVNKELLTFKLMKEKNQTLYVMSNKNFASQGLFKVGKTINKASKRATNLNTANPIGEDITVLYEIKTYDSLALEKRCHSIFQNLRPTKKREYFLCVYDRLIRLLNIIADNMDKEINEVNEIVKIIYDKSDNKWTAGLNMNIFEPKVLSITISQGTESKTETVNITNMTDVEKLELAKKIIERFIQDKKGIPNYDFETNKNNLYENKPIEIKWCNIRDYCSTKYKGFKKSEWRSLFRDITLPTNGVNYKWR